MIIVPCKERRTYLSINICSAQHSIICISICYRLTKINLEKTTPVSNEEITFAITSQTPWVSNLVRKVKLINGCSCSRIHHKNTAFTMTKLWGSTFVSGNKNIATIDC